MTDPLSIPIGFRIIDRDMETLGYLVRRERERRMLTSTQLAAKLGVSQSTLSRIENDKIVEAPEPRLMRKFKDELGIPQHVALSALGYEVGPVTAGVIDTDPALIELIDLLRRLPLTDNRPSSIRNMINVFADIDRRAAESRKSIDTEGDGRDIAGVNGL